MGKAFAIAALHRKRARLAGEMALAEKSLAKLRQVLDTIDATINLFEPATNPELIPPVRPYVRGVYFRYGELTRFCYAALRQADGPIAVRAIADYAIAAKALDAGRYVREKIVAQTHASLTRMLRRGRVRKVIDWPETWWELAAR
jgi:hypothetical protein